VSKFLLVSTAVAVALVIPADTGFAQQAPSPPPAAADQPPNDYASPDAWLCRPGRQDTCATDLTTTVVSADGRLTREAWTASPAAAIDCFYVYPTVSTDPGRHSDMNPDPAEINVVRQQFARFASACRPFAPMYRQVTLAGLMSVLGPGGGFSPLQQGLGSDDVRAAWRHYLQHDNQGRGVVLIGHSQGAMILTELMRQEIDGKPIQARLVSALLLGTTVAVAKDKITGGDFQTIPLCTAAAQTGCVITFASYRSTVPPPSNTLFGRVATSGQVAACTNPAALGGGSGELHSYLTSDGRTITGSLAPKPWVVPEPKIETPWVSVPGLLTARCATNEHATYLEVTVNGNPADPRTDDITGDLGFGGRVQTNWGLHLIDVNLAIGNLIEIVGAQARAHGQRR
jgi:hypothetical protein